MTKKKVRQAVLIIHGIGEQRPMETLRGFVDSILSNPESDDSPKFWSKPDTISESYELRQLRSVRLRNETHFYEYYWAHHMEGTRYAHIWRWVRHLLITHPAHIPPRLRSVWALTWLLLVLALYLTVSGVRLPEGSRFMAFTAAFVVSLVNFFIMDYVGDAARYINPSPQNIGRRQTIRSEGVKLLRRLHEQGQYDRIIVVGHSLGSMIAYDILRHTWDLYNDTHARPTHFKQTALDELENAIWELEQDPSAAKIETFREKQRALWIEQRKFGNQWRVTDFVTLGCPLTYAAILLGRTRAQLDQLKIWREVPTCPPVRDSGRLYYPSQYETLAGIRSFKILHHAAVFACTRWTNLYFPGDLIGGPLNGVLGHGIKDICIPNPSGLGRIPLVPHTWYWRHEPAKSGTKAYKEQKAVQALWDTLELNTQFWRETLSSI